MERMENERVLFSSLAASTVGATPNTINSKEFARQIGKQ